MTLGGGKPLLLVPQKKIVLTIGSVNLTQSAVYLSLTRAD
jgi:hypothetical protein